MAGAESKKNIYRGRVANLFLEKHLLPTGKTVDIEKIEHVGAAAVLPVLPNGDVVLIRQYRPAVGQYLYEIPAGTLEPGESPRSCGKREIMEETGLEGGRLKRLVSILPAPGYTTEKIHIYLATGFSLGEQHLEGDEIIDVKVMTVERALALISSGRITDAKTIVAILYYVSIPRK